MASHDGGKKKEEKLFAAGGKFSCFACKKANRGKEGGKSSTSGWKIIVHMRRKKQERKHGSAFWFYVCTWPCMALEFIHTTLFFEAKERKFAVVDTSQNPYHRWIIINFLFLPLLCGLQSCIFRLYIEGSQQSRRSKCVSKWKFQWREGKMCLDRFVPSENLPISNTSSWTFQKCLTFISFYAITMTEKNSTNAYIKNKKLVWWRRVKVSQEKAQYALNLFNFCRGKNLRKKNV